jgi:hypothetical protein
VAADGSFQFGGIQEVALLHGDAIGKWLERLWRANQCSDGMAVLDGLANDLEAGASCGTEDN